MTVLNDTVKLIGATVDADKEMIFGHRSELAAWLAAQGFAIDHDDPQTVYAAVRQLNAAGCHYPGRKNHRLPTEPLPEGHRFMIVDQMMPDADKPVWAAKPLKEALKLESYEGQVRLLHHHTRIQRRADKVLTKTNEADVDQALVETARVQSVQANHAARAQKVVLDATNPALRLGETEPLLSISATRDAVYKRLIKKLDSFDTETDPGFTI